MSRDMKHDRWTVKDKIAQYKGINRLHEMTVLHTKDLTQSLRKKQGKEIKSLNKQNTKYRQEYGLSIHGNREKLVPVLQSRPTLQLAYQNLNPADIEEDLKQLMFSKKKELDRLRYKKKQREEVFLALKLELSELQYATSQPMVRVWEEQELANEIENISTKQIAAASMKEASINMINILKKDTIRFDQVLEGLKNDFERQCQCIIKAERMSYDAVRELIKLQDEYNVTEKQVWSSMKERDRAIRNMKAEIENIKLYQAPKIDISQEVQRAVAVTQEMSSDETVEPSADTFMEKELRELTEILTELQEVTLVQKFEDIFPRIMEQLKHKARLQRQVDLNEEQKTKILKLRSSMDVLLEVILYHTQTEEAVKFQSDKKDLKERIGNEKLLLTELQKEIEGKGETILQIRTALITLNILLSQVCPIQDDIVLMTLEPEREVTSGTDYTIKPLMQPKTDAIYVLNMVTEKLKWVMSEVSKKKFGLAPAPKAITRMTFESIGEDILEDEYDTIVSAMLDELSEVEDPTVPTNKDIKAQSRRIVEQFEDPRAAFKGSTAPQFKKHKCF